MYNMFKNGKKKKGKLGKGKGGLLESISTVSNELKDLPNIDFKKAPKEFWGYAGGFLLFVVIIAYVSIKAL